MLLLCLNSIYSPKYTQENADNPCKCSCLKACACYYLSLAMWASCMNRRLTERLYCSWLGYHNSLYSRMGICSRLLLLVWSLGIPHMWIASLLWGWRWISTSWGITCNKTYFALIWAYSFVCLLLFATSSKPTSY